MHEKIYKKRHENILVYNILCKTSIGLEPVRIKFNKIEGFIKIRDKIRYLVSFNYSCCDKMCHEIKYLLSEKGSIADSINQNFARIRTDSDDSLSIEKILTFHNVIILIKSVFNKNKNEYYYNIYLGKGSYRDKSNTE